MLADLARRAHGGSGNLLEATGVVLGEEDNRHRLPGQAFQPHAGHDFEQVLEVDRLSRGQIHDRRIPALAASPLLSEGDAPERRAEFGQAASDRLRRHVAGRIGMLGAVAEHDDAGDLAAGDRPHCFLEGSADGGLTRRFGGRPRPERKQLCLGSHKRTQLPIERPGNDLESTPRHEVAGPRLRGCQCRGELLPATPSPLAVGHGHALRGIGEHEHDPLLPCLAARHDRGPHHAGDQCQERGQPQGDEHEPAAAPHPGAVRWDRE